MRGSSAWNEAQYSTAISYGTFSDAPEYQQFSEASFYIAPNKTSFRKEPNRTYFYSTWIFRDIGHERPIVVWRKLCEQNWLVLHSLILNQNTRSTWLLRKRGKLLAELLITISFSPTSLEIYQNLTSTHSHQKT